jgi:thiamine pyrophosphate-dependent acetolactate synthase large subunit-like protein
MKAAEDKRRANAPAPIERPLPSEGGSVWGSDAVAELLRALDIPYIALNPGASYRGLHDSLINRLGNAKPQMLLALHEESAVAIAHGWAKVTGRPMAAIVHSNVGLMHATMAVFNAWCDRIPLLLLGATGPVDAAKRRPWIDWIHTARDQGALVRNYTKWDDQPASVAAAQESILRAWQMIQTAPHAPAYICLDAGMQELKLDALPALPDIARFKAPAPAAPDAALTEEAAKRLHAAARPLILMGRVSREDAGWQDRVRLAESLGALVLTDLKQAAAFPSDHKLLAAPPATFPSVESAALLREADAVLALDWVDLAGTLKAAWRGEEVKSFVIHATLDQHLHNGWSMDHQGLAPVDLLLQAEPEPTVSALNAALAKLGARKAAAWQKRQPIPPRETPAVGGTGTITVPHLAVGLQKALAGRQTSLIRHPLSWAGHLWPIRHPLDFLGSDGGGGVGSGPGTSVGAALALRDGDSGRMPVAILGDGDFLMGVTALWTAVHYRVPLLILVANNRSFYNDEVHQERVAKERDRPVANKWIGQHITHPDIDLAAMAKAQGAASFGPVHDLADLPAALKQAIAATDEGAVAVVDVRVAPGYDSGTAGALARAPGAR